MRNARNRGSLEATTTIWKRSQIQSMSLQSERRACHLLWLICALLPSKADDSASSIDAHGVFYFHVKAFYSLKIAKTISAKRFVDMCGTLCANDFKSWQS